MKMVIMEAFLFAFDITVAQTKQGTRFFELILHYNRNTGIDSKALESKLFLIGLNRLMIDQAQRCVNFTLVKIKVKIEHNRGQTAYDC